MSGKFTTLELIARIAEDAGISRKLSTELIRVLPEVIEAGLERDGEVRVPGFGTFRLKWVETRFARNLRTGEEVEVPAHSKVVFLPEKALKEQVNGDFRYLTYQVIDRGSGLTEDTGQKSEVRSQETEEGSVEPEVERHREVERTLEEVKEPADAVEYVREVIHRSETDPEAENAYPEPGTAGTDVPWFTEPEDQPADGSAALPEVRKRNVMYWIIPLLFLIIALLVVVFYMKNFRNQLVYPENEMQTEQQAVNQAEPEPELQPVVSADTGRTQATDTATVAAVQEPEQAPEQAPPQPITASETVIPSPGEGFVARQVQVTGGKYLFQLAREVYGNPYLWSLIYGENQEKISDPQQVLTGLTLTIPGLEGTPDRLTRSDSARVAEGYRLIYDYYNALGDERAKEYRWAVNKYSPK